MDTNEETDLSKKHESDLTRQEKRQLELQKLKGMSGKERISYIWTYYKVWFAVLLGIIVLLCMAGEIIHNSRQVELLSVSVADCGYDVEEGKSTLTADLLDYIGTGDRWETVTLDTSVESGDDYTAVMKRTVVIASETTDILICGSELYDAYGDEGAFLTAEELLGEDYDQYASCITDGKIDLSKSEKWTSYGLTEYEPVYVGVLATAKHTENAKKMVEFLCS